MKKLIALFLLLYSFTCYSQQDVKFTGIGIFKINSDTSVLYNYIADHRLKPKIINEEMDYLHRTYYGADSKDIFKLVANNEPGKYFSEVSDCPDVKEFYLGEYSINGISLKGLRLKYYKNQLVNVKCKYSRLLADAMKVKYGDPISIISADTTKCVYKLTGITEKLTTNDFTDKWQNAEITAKSYLGEYYDDNCQKKILSYFTYWIDNKECSHCESEFMNKKILNRNAPKISKDELKDF